MNNVCTTEYVSKEQLQQEADMRKQLVASRQNAFKSFGDNRQDAIKAYLEDSVSAPEIKKLPAYKAIASIADSKMRTLVEDATVKAVESYDLNGVRFVSYWDQISTLANRQTVFTDIIQANGIVRSTDFQIRWRENYANANALVQFFNLNAGLPSEAELLRAIRGNTMGAFGNLLNIRFITDELASQSTIMPTNERALQLQMQMVRMLRFMNQKLLANTELTSEIIGDTPQWGGFVTRSELNNTILGAGSDLTDALINSQVQAIANASSVEGLGYVPLVCLTTASQITKIRSLIISRFPGEKSNSYLDYQALLQDMLPGVPLPAYMYKMYQTDPGTPIAFIQEPQLAAGTAVFFDPRQPRMAKFQMMGQYGPWIIERPTPELTTLLVAFDFLSLIDPLRESRAVYLNLN